jgi:hypothetical protein
MSGWRHGRMCPAPCKDRARSNPGLIFFDPWVPREAIERHFPRDHGKYRAVARLRGLKMPAIMSLEEPRPRGTVVGERADRRRVSEAENFFRCTFAAAISTRGITYGFWITKARCRTRRKIKRNSADRSSMRARGAFVRCSRCTWCSRRRPRGRGAQSFPTRCRPMWRVFYCA